MNPTLRVAIVGSGPSGLYAADSLLNRKELSAGCDVFDRLPTPYGLVRGGVAPDHQNIKGVVRVYEKIASHPGFRFFGNVKIGRDLSVDDLRAAYDAIIYAVGNESETRMGLPSEDLPGCYSATEFVGWYNGHPDFSGRSFNLDVEGVAVIGLGNVAMDVARVLAREAKELTVTDMADYACRALAGIRKLKTIYIVGRRGPAQAAFSPKEIKEIGTLANADLLVNPADIQVEGVPLEKTMVCDWATHENLAYLNKKAQTPPEGKPRQIFLRFLRSPVECLAGPDGKLAGLKLEINQLVNDAKGVPRPKGTGQFETLPVGALFKAIGYRGIPLEGVPFDERKGIIPNAEGRVLTAAGATQPLGGEYVVGWSKRGPSGLIGTNKPDSIATVDALVQDFVRPSGPPHRAAGSAEALVKKLESQGVRYVTFQDWHRIDAAEIARGKLAGKIREKFFTIPDLVQASQNNSGSKSESPVPAKAQKV